MLQGTGRSSDRMLLNKVGGSPTENSSSGETWPEEDQGEDGDGQEDYEDTALLQLLDLPGRAKRNIKLPDALPLHVDQPKALTMS